MVDNTKSEQRISVVITGETTTWNDGKGNSQPAELVESDLVSWLEDHYGMKNVKVVAQII